MKTILLTGDDGYNSLGTRVLIHHLRKDFKLAIAGTSYQQSGVGGLKSITKTGTWGETKVEGIPAFWIEGSPVDAMESARVYFHHPFDYVISGINWGANMGGCLFSSGTFAAADYAIHLGITKQAIAISWDLPAIFHFKNHSLQDGVASYIDHPGKAAYTVIRETLKQKFWGADIININIPEKISSVIEVVKPVTPICGLWSDIKLDKKTKTFNYERRNHSTKIGSRDTDIQALTRGHIAVSPCQSTLLDKEIYQHMISLKHI